MNGAKSRVEKLCQAFENGKDLVELSELYAHDISNVLKLFLRQVNKHYCLLYSHLYIGRFIKVDVSCVEFCENSSIEVIVGRFALWLFCLYWKDRKPSNYRP